jgi:hypothetical protein
MICQVAFFICRQGRRLGDRIMAISPKLPNFNQLLNLAIGLAILFLILGFLPESIKKFFRV